MAQKSLKNKHQSSGDVLVSHQARQRLRNNIQDRLFRNPNVQHLELVRGLSRKKLKMLFQRQFCGHSYAKFLSKLCFNEILTLSPNFRSYSARAATAVYTKSPSSFTSCSNTFLHAARREFSLLLSLTSARGVERDSSHHRRPQHSGTDEQPVVDRLCCDTTRALYPRHQGTVESHGYKI